MCKVRRLSLSSPFTVIEVDEIPRKRLQEYRDREYREIDLNQYYVYKVSLRSLRSFTSESTVPQYTGRVLLPSDDSFSTFIYIPSGIVSYDVRGCRYIDSTNVFGRERRPTRESVSNLSVDPGSTRSVSDTFTLYFGKDDLLDSGNSRPGTESTSE